MNQYFSRDCAMYFSITIDLLHNGSRIMQDAQRFKKQVYTHFCVKGYQYQSNIQPSRKNIPYTFLPPSLGEQAIFNWVVIKKPTQSSWFMCTVHCINSWGPRCWKWIIIIPHTTESPKGSATPPAAFPRCWCCKA